MAAILILAVAFAVGFFTFNDYGVGWDSNAQRLMGRVNANYVSGDSQDLLSFADRDYGPLFALALHPLERLRDTSRILPARALAVHLFFLACAIAFYAFLYLHYKNPWLAAAGLAMLLLTPRIYGHSFFNSKDLPALGFWMLNLLALRLLVGGTSGRPCSWRGTLCDAGEPQAGGPRLPGPLWASLRPAPDPRDERLSSLWPSCLPACPSFLLC
jgi:hypothetical protein